MTDSTPSLANAIHAARTWLERMGAVPAAAAVVVVHPVARVGFWTPGSASVGVLPSIDDSAAELCEAVASAVQAGYEQLPAGARESVADAMASGAQLRAVLAPAAEVFRLELLHAGQRVELCVATLRPEQIN